MIVTINEKDLQKLVNNAVVSVLNSLNITKKEGDLESPSAYHTSIFASSNLLYAK